MERSQITACTHGIAFNLTSARFCAMVGDNLAVLSILLLSIRIVVGTGDGDKAGVWE